MKKLALVSALALTVTAAAMTGCGKTAAPSEGGKEIFENLSTTDLQGNEVTSDIFKKNDLTLINTWASWCGPCVGEIPELDKLEKEYKEKGIPVEIIGMVMEANPSGIKAGLSQKERSEVEKILESTGAQYQQLLVSDDLAKSELSEQTGFPTTYFVDKNGKMVGSPITGSDDLEDWKKTVEERLKEVQNEK